MSRLTFLSVLVCAAALAAPINRVIVGDLPGTSGQWQTGEVVVDVPSEQVQIWLCDFSAWPSLFPDVESAELGGVAADGRTVVRFRSRVLGRTMTIRVHAQPGLITYDGEGEGVVTQGKIFIAPVSDHETRVVMQTTAEVHGLAGAFATSALKRNRAFKKLRSDLTALIQLSHSYASGPQPGS